MTADKIAINVTINGTDTNPWRRLGLKQNPFPQTGIAEFAAGERQLASLDGDPVTGPDDIRKRLAGCSQELVNLCIANWRPGQRVKFQITFPRYREDGAA